MRRSLFSLVSLGAVALSALLTPLTARADQSLYTDALQNGWSNWSWATTNLSSTSPVHAGADAISVNSDSYQALYLHHGAFDSTPYGNLVFWINGGAGGQSLQVAATLNGTAQAPYPLPPLAANTWTKVTISLAALKVSGTTTLDGFWIQETSGATLPTYSVDDISLSDAAPPVDPGTLTVDASAGRHPINPLIYGVAFASASSLADLNAPLNRSGGNGMTTYNWLQNATNHASDYYYESLPENGSAPGQLVDEFVSASRTAGAKSMITVPTIGWVAKLGSNRGPLYSFSVAKYGAQKGADPYHSDAGNGVKPDGTNLTGNDPNDANVPSDVNFQGNWIDHLVSTWGQSSSGGVSYYLMDNEPSIWYATHRDIHPVGPKIDEILETTKAYGARVKSADPTALVVGPEEWGWSGYFYSGYDLQYGNQHGYQNLPDRTAHGGMDSLPWLLQQLAAYDKTTGQRSLDVFSVHYYPQGNGEFSEAADETTALLRNRSTRDLWDPAYTSQSWINDKVMLIPRIKNWANTYYPGTKTGITEYNWGAEGNINGATTQADIYGIFGREGLDLATRWTTPSSTSPVYKAMKLYRNYDGNKSTFGDTSVSAIAPNPDNVSTFAAVRSSDGALTVMVINKQLHASAPLKLTLKNFTPGGPAQTWQVTSANTITHLADTATTGGLLQTTVPLQSITLFVVPRALQTAALIPAADTYVNSGSSAGVNYGTASSLAVKKYGGASSVYNRVTYLKFDLSQITTAPKTAVLSMVLNSADKTIAKAVACKIYGVANSGWTETGLTWNSAAASESLNAATVVSTGTYVATTSVGPALKTYTWDLSSYLKTKAGQVVTLQIIDEGGTGAFCGFNSRESATGKPTLTVTY